MSPRQMHAYLLFTRRRRIGERAELLALHAMAARADGKDIGKELRRAALALEI